MFLAGSPNYGAGQLDAGSNGGHHTGKVADSDHTSLPEQSSFYKNLVGLHNIGQCILRIF